MASEQPIQKLKHDAKPGYLMAFTISFSLMSLYLAFILYSSPGQVKYEYHGKKSSYKESHSKNKTADDATKH